MLLLRVFPELYELFKSIIENHLNQILFHLRSQIDKCTEKIANSSSKIVEQETEMVEILIENFTFIIHMSYINQQIDYQMSQLIEKEILNFLGFLAQFRFLLKKINIQLDMNILSMMSDFYIQYKDF